MAEEEYTGEVSKEELERLTAAREAAQTRAAVLDKPITALPDEAQSHRAFVAAKEYANARFLVVKGTPVKTPFMSGNPIGVQPISHREGDVFATFVGGVLVTADPRIIDWCLKNPAKCRPADDSRSRAWASIKEGQTPLANREAVVPSDIDADEMFYGGGMAEAIAPGAQAGLVEAAADAARKADEDAGRERQDS